MFVLGIRGHAETPAEPDFDPADPHEPGDPLSAHAGSFALELSMNAGISIGPEAYAVNHANTCKQPFVVARTL